MTGEMHKSEVTRDRFPIYFDCADLVKGATVEPFDQYQGPYIHVPDHGRIFLSTEDGCIGQWFDEANDTVSHEFMLELEDNGPVGAFQELLETGGTPVERES